MILTAFGSVITALGLQKAAPALLAYWIKRRKDQTAASLEQARVESTTAVEVERIELEQLLERERLAFSREQEFHRLETALREELQKDREDLRERVSAVAKELAQVSASNQDCHRQRQHLVRAMRRQERECRKEIGVLQSRIEGVTREFAQLHGRMSKRGKVGQ